MPVCMATKALDLLGNTSLPPWCFELVLQNGRTFWVYSAGEGITETDEAIWFRVWDMRGLSNAALAHVMANILALPNRQWRPQDLHRHLDWGVLHVRRADVAYFMAWNERLWPLETDAERTRFGFTLPDLPQ